MPKAGDVVTFEFPAAGGKKNRPAVVLSSDQYHAERPDLLLGILTSNTAAAKSSTDHVLDDWSIERLRLPTAFRVYLTMAQPSACRVIGRLSDHDWEAVRVCVRRALG